MSAAPAAGTTIDVLKPGRAGGYELVVEWVTFTADQTYDRRARVKCADGKTYPVHPPDAQHARWWAWEHEGLAPRPVRPHMPWTPG